MLMCMCVVVKLLKESANTNSGKEFQKFYGCWAKISKGLRLSKICKLYDVVTSHLVIVVMNVKFCYSCECLTKVYMRMVMNMKFHVIGLSCSYMVSWVYYTHG